MDFANAGGSGIVGKISYSLEWGKDFAGAALDFGQSYWTLRQVTADQNLIGADKYFHCKANFEAASRGPGGKFFAEHFSNLREVADQRWPKFSPRWDSFADQRANLLGRSQAGTAASGCAACQPYMPSTLKPQYQ